MVVGFLFRFNQFQYQQSSTKSAQGFAIVPFAPNQQWCFHQIEQSHHQHAAYRWAIHYMGIPEFEIGPRTHLQTWLCQGKLNQLISLTLHWNYFRTFILEFQADVLINRHFHLLFLFVSHAFHSTRDNVCQSLTTSPSSVNWSVVLTFNAWKI